MRVRVVTGTNGQAVAAERMRLRLRQVLMANHLLKTYTPLRSEPGLAPLKMGLTTPTFAVLEQMQFRHFRTQPVQAAVPIPRRTRGGIVNVALRHKLNDVIFPTGHQNASVFRLTSLELTPLLMEFRSEAYLTHVLADGAPVVSGIPAAVGYVESERGVPSKPPPSHYPQAVFVSLTLEATDEVPAFLARLAAKGGGLRRGYVAVLVDDHPLLPGRRFFLFPTVDPIEDGIQENTWRIVSEMLLESEELEENSTVRLTPEMDERVNKLIAYLRQNSEKALVSEEAGGDAATKGNKKARQRERKRSRREEAREKVEREQEVVNVLSGTLIEAVIDSLHTTCVPWRPSPAKRAALCVPMGPSTSRVQRFLAERWNRAVLAEPFIVQCVES